MLQLFYVLVAALTVFFILALLRSRRLREKYAALWIVVGLAIVLLATVPGLLKSLSQLLGFEVPSNLLFVLAIFLLLGVALHLSLEISRLEDETRVLAENIAILNLIVTEAGLTEPLSHTTPTGPAGPAASTGRIHCAESHRTAAGPESAGPPQPGPPPTTTD
ncbi:DUF2304 domain-containing protein [Actinomyces capricornis]|uniref:DUF2304 domain-containing protein n=1 Tax=Actinomyces capricornis TaxID=2755559 RepID=A0ABM7U8G1_9ACTO|nr:DUF2304 domain-containing protein [Actinomyces capricornis]BDA63676.1 hypothetical protein MANAM107_05100 [Actinomyces capricornis]